MKLTKQVKIVLAVFLAIAGYAVLAHFNLVPSAIVQKASVPERVDLPTEVPSAPSATVVAAALPTSAPAKVGGPLVRVDIWAWNAQMGLIFANGGPQTTAGSLMEKHGVRLALIRQDDTEKSKAEQIKFAQSLANGDASDGTQFVIIMGDGAAQYIAAVNKALVKLGPDYRAEVVGAVGYSRGEDAFMGPAEWKDSPEAAKGGLVAGVLRDGDWNIAQDFLRKNDIRNNPDERTYDPTALNWVAADDYVKAAEMYISGYCEDRVVVRDGKKTSDTKHVCVQGAVTWTPGDVNIAKKKGGVVKILSTKENLYQMPSVIIGIHKWNVDHAKTVEGLLAAAFDGADQVRSFEPALSRAAKASYAIYAEESPAYWSKYYKGVTERDKTGNAVFLGGSAVANLGDNLVLFGLAEGTGGSSSVFRATYEGFGRVVQKQYPTLVPSFPPASEAVNTQFLAKLKASAPESKPEVVAEFTDNTPAIPVENIAAKRNWSIQFDTGKATFTPAALATLDELYGQVAGNAFYVEIDGHTDNTGGAGANQTLSASRASAVRDFLRAKAPAFFPENRVTVRAFGDSQPIAPNTSEVGRAQNRRVTVILGSK
jgi:OOP family OmpA-OmpF porin